MQNNKPLISFILPNYNNQHVINLFFDKFLENNTYDNYEFIVCDDGSEDDGLELLYKWQKSGKIKNLTIIAEPHRGIVNALNKCLYAAKGDFIIRCDGDATIETKSFVEKFLSFYYISPEKIGVITSKVIADSGCLHALGRSVISKEGLLNRGKEPTEKIGKRVWDYKTEPVNNLDEIIDEVAEVDTALGVFTFCDRATALKIGGFDNNYPLWIEDDDFYLSFRLHGKKCFYLPEIEICHHFALRGNRNPKLWSKHNQNKKWKWIYSKELKNAKTKYKIFNIPVLKIKETDTHKKYYLFGIQFLTKKFLGWRPKILIHDYNYWKEKWGFDILNPDMDDIKGKYKDTELLWNYDPKLKQEGLKIINKYIKQKKNYKSKYSKTSKLKKIIFIGEGCWFVDSFLYFKEHNISVKVIIPKQRMVLWRCNEGIFRNVGAEILLWKNTDKYIEDLNLDENTLVIGGGNFGGDIYSFAYRENLKEKNFTELQILYQISKYNHDNNLRAKIIRYFNGDTGFGSQEMINLFEEKTKYVDTFMFDNNCLSDFILNNIPKAKNKKICFGWMESPLERYVIHNTCCRYDKEYISIGRIICSTKLDYHKLKTLIYPINYRNMKRREKIVFKFIHEFINKRKTFYGLAGNLTFNCTLVDRKLFYESHKGICFGLSHFYDIFDNSIEKFHRNKKYYFSLDGQKEYCNKGSTKELYYAFINNPSKDIVYLMNGIIPLISHTEHNVYKEMVDRKMAILIQKPEDIEAVLKLTDEEIQEYRDNIYANRDLFTFDHVGEMLMNLLDEKEK